ncbi:MAG: hypothetical protein H0U67_01460 [Gemmatimonadetes bacterium]|nr:hypothetical protein [Gemmatimonadota bacterium]
MKSAELCLTGLSLSDLTSQTDWIGRGGIGPSVISSTIHIFYAAQIHGPSRISQFFGGARLSL